MQNDELLTRSSQVPKFTKINMRFFHKVTLVQNFNSTMKLICFSPISEKKKKKSVQHFPVHQRKKSNRFWFSSKFPMVFTWTQHLTRPLMFSVEHIIHIYRLVVKNTNKCHQHSLLAATISLLFIFLFFFLLFWSFDFGLNIFFFFLDSLTLEAFLISRIVDEWC